MSKEDEVYDQLDKYIQDLIDKVDRQSALLAQLVARVFTLENDYRNLKNNVNILNDSKKNIWD